MLSLDPRPDLFRTSLPESFFNEEIMQKYDAFTKQKNYVFKDFKSVINESIRAFDLPTFSLAAAFQEQRHGTSSIEQPVAPSQTIQRSIDNTFTITFRHTEAYMTYWCLVEHWFSKYKLGPDGDRTPIEFLLLEIQNYESQSIVKLQFEKVLFTGVDGLSLAYNQNERVSDSFTASFSYGSLKPSFSIPELKLTN